MRLWLLCLFLSLKFLLQLRFFILFLLQLLFKLLDLLELYLWGIYGKSSILFECFNEILSESHAMPELKIFARIVDMLWIKVRKKAKFSFNKESCILRKSSPSWSIDQRLHKEITHVNDIEMLPSVADDKRKGLFIKTWYRFHPILICVCIVKFL